jgi:hypothetical protein
MKTKKFIKKVERYLILSKEFEKKEEDLFEERAVVVNTSFSNLGNTGMGSNALYINVPCTVGGNTLNNSFIGVLTSKTRSEVILEEANSERESALKDAEKVRKEAQFKADKSDRYDEYLLLRDEIYCYTENSKL